MKTQWIRLALCAAFLAVTWGQQPPLPPPMPPQNLPPGFGPRAGAPPPAQPPKPQAQPAEAQPAQGAKATPPATSAVQETAGGYVLNLQNASLTEVIDLLARRLKINYIIDPRVKGGVTLNTYGEIKQVDSRALLETVLHINGQAMVQVGDIYRIVPITDVARLPMPPQLNAKSFADDDRVILNLIFLKYSTVGELSKLLTPFIGEGAQMIAYDPANLLLLLDSSRNMKRTMELIALFDSDTLAGQRVRLFEVKNSRPSDLAKELESVLRSISLNEKASAVRFLAIDRINTVVAIAPNPGAFVQIEEWLKKLDIPQKATAGTMDNYVYRVKYGYAPAMAGAIMDLYLGITYPGMGGYGMGGYGMGGYGMGGGMYGGGMGGGMYGGGLGGGTYGGALGGGMGGGGYGGIYGGGLGMAGYPSFPGGGSGNMLAAPLLGGYAGAAGQAPAASAVTTTAGTSSGAQDLTGSYLGAGAGASALWAKLPRVIPNPFDNTLLIHASPQDYEQILKLIEQLDIPPRQILVEAKIYEVNLQGQLQAGVQAWLQQLTDSRPTGFPDRAVRAATSSAAGLTLTAGMVVGNSRQLLGALSGLQSNGKAKLVSAPSIIATDSIPATMNVGSEVPTLAAQAVNSITQSGNSLFTQSIQSRSTGVTLNVLARANPSGVITMVINQDVSAPVAPAATSAIQSPSFSHRTVNTQITLQDGDTIAIAGIILENDTWSSAGVPFLHRIPVLGLAFGQKILTKDRTEMVIFMTPRIIYDTNQLVEASDELKSKLKRLTKIYRE